MRRISALIVAVCCLTVAGTAAGGNSGASSSCYNPKNIGLNEEAIYVHLEVIDRGKRNVSRGFALRWFKGENYSMAGWARGCGWTTNVYAAKRLPRKLCVSLHDGFRSQLKDEECQSWQWVNRGGERRREMVFRVTRG